MSNYTQGPWKADGYSIYQASTGTRHVAEIAYTGPHHTPPEEYPKSCRLQDEANARLIAAAPELLDTLMMIDPFPVEEVEESRNGNTVYCEITVKEIRLIRAAIAKATNEMP